MDRLAIYLFIINIAAFVAFTIDCFHYKRNGKPLFNSILLSMFSAFGGGAGMLAAFLAWDRRVTKKNIAWRFEAIIGIVIWSGILLIIYDVVEFDPISTLSTFNFEKLSVALAYLIVINIATFAVFAIDKANAASNRKRLPELVLMGMPFLGGAIGGIIAMQTVRHKTRVWYFKYGLPAFIVLQITVCAYLLFARIA